MRPRFLPTSSRGFTLIEMMIVIAIIAVLVSLTVWSFNVQKQRVEVRQSARRFKSAVERTRTLAISAGAHLGQPTFTNCNGGNQMAVTVDTTAETYQVPVNLRFDGAGNMVVDCETIDVSVESGGRAEIRSETGPLVFAFTGTGRLAGAPVFVGFERIDQGGTTTDRTLSPGYQILPSGMVCRATNATSGCVED